MKPHLVPDNLPVVADDLTAIERVQSVNPAFTAEGIKNLVRLVDCVRRVVRRLRAAGWRIEGDELVPPVRHHRTVEDEDSESKLSI